MSIVGGWRARLRALLDRDTADRELSDEIGFHIDLETDQNVRRGMPPDEARRVAIARFGGVQRVREEHRDVRRVRWLEDAWADGRFALRTLRRTPALAAAAVITLALGIGANVAIFSAVNAVVLQPLPFPGAGRLVVIGENDPEKHWHMQVAAGANLLDWRAGVNDFADVMGYFEGVGTTVLTGRGDPTVLGVSTVTGNFFSTLGVPAARGRTFTFNETFRTGTHVVVLSDKAWRDTFGRDASIVGKSITVDGRTCVVIGVMPSGFSYPREGIDVWQPFEYDRSAVGGVDFRRAHTLRAVARLKPGATLAHADAELQSVVQRLARQYPETNRYMGAGMVPLHDFLVGDTRTPLLVLLTSVAFLLLIACANVGNLLLLQAAGRHREAALRLALGANRGRLVRQAFTESVMLSAVGGAFGLALGWLGTRVLVRLQPQDMLRVHDFGIDLPVVAYVLAISALSGILFGVAPALWARHRDPAESLQDAGRGSVHGMRTRRWGGGEVLVVGEVALALLMTVGAGLLVRSFMQLQRVNPGFDPHLVWVGAVGLDHAYDTDAKISAFMRELQERSRALPGVTDAALAMNPPLTGAGWTSDFIGYGRPAGDYGTEVSHAFVSPGYFATMKVPLLRGRTFNTGDTRETTPVIVINDLLARSYFRGEDPIGQRIAFDEVPAAKSTWYTVIGVVGNEHSDALDVAPKIEVYESSSQDASAYMSLVIRTTRDPAALTASVRSMLHDLDPMLALTHVTTIDELRDQSLARLRFLTTLMLMFGVIGLTLSVVGVYGVLAQAVRNRMREMGVRVALGAPPTSIRWLVVRHGLRLTIVGLVIGAASALVATHAMTKLLFGVPPDDPLTILVVSLVLAGTSALAAWLPAWRASRADPAVVLRGD